MDITTATPAELKRLYDHIAVQMRDDRFFTTKELALLPKIMTGGEWLYGFSSGFMDSSTWLIVLTSKRVIFLNKNLLWGHEETSVGLGKINSVQKKTGIMFGTIMIHDGSREYQIRNVWKKSVIPFTNRLDQAIEEFERAARAGSPIPPPIYPWDIAETPSDPEPDLVEYNHGPDRLPDPAPAAIEFPSEPVSGPLRAYLDSVPSSPEDVLSRGPTPYASPISPLNPDPALKARLDRLRKAGAISDAEYDRQITGGV